MTRLETFYYFFLEEMCVKKYRVFIFSKKNSDAKYKILDEMKTQIKNYDKCNGIFILACFIENYGYDFEIVDCAT